MCTELEKRMHYSERKRPDAYATINREAFACLEVNVSSNSEFMRKSFEEAHRILPHLNLGQANSSETRALSVAEIDNLSGIIAERACAEVLRWIYGNGKIVRPDNQTSYNQIDLKLYNEKTIEVRSSCVRNGIDFALFAKSKNPKESQYFDVLGPYTNGYKAIETYKDYYMRVFFECDKKDFMSLLKAPFLQMYITGGATKEMMQNASLLENKHLTPEGGQVTVVSDYRVIPMGKSLDIREYLDRLESENDQLIRCRQIPG